MWRLLSLWTGTGDEALSLGLLESFKCDAVSEVTETVISQNIPSRPLIQNASQSTMYTVSHGNNEIYMTKHWHLQYHPSLPRSRCWGSSRNPSTPLNTAAWETKSIPVNYQSISEDPDKRRTSVSYALGPKLRESTYNDIQHYWLLSSYNFCVFWE